MGIFDGKAGDVFTTYHVVLEMRDKLMGGIPKDPKIIEGWLRSKAGIEQEEEIRQAMVRTLLELGAEVHVGQSFEELEAASKELAAVKNTNGFKSHAEGGLYLESRVVKAMLKEVVSILYSGERWLKGFKPGYSGKAARSVAAERLFISPDKLWLGRKDPDGVEMVIGHITGPQGPRSTLGYHEYVSGARVAFDVMVAEDALPEDAWPRLWLLAQENGLGAMRSQGHGRFDVLSWEKVKPGHCAATEAARALAYAG